MMWIEPWSTDFQKSSVPWKAAQESSSSDVHNGMEQALIYLSRSLQETHEASKWVNEDNSMKRLFSKYVARLREPPRNYETRKGLPD